jgi:hypothetical protein
VTLGHIVLRAERPGPTPRPAAGAPDAGGTPRDRSRDASGVTAAERQPPKPNHPVVRDVEQPSAEETREDVFISDHPSHYITACCLHVTRHRHPWRIHMEPRGSNATRTGINPTGSA